MPLFEWTADMSIGIEVIDTDHKMLVSLINLLDDAIASGATKETTGSVLNALYDYTDYHFRREEMMMEACAYPEIEGHMKSHISLKSRVMEIRDDYDKGENANIEHDILEFLKNWLKEHIMGRDRLYQSAMASHPDEIEQANQKFLKSPAWPENQS